MLCRERGGGRDEDARKEGVTAQGRWRRGARHGTPRRVIAVAGGGKSGDRVAREQRLRRAVARQVDSWSGSSVGDGPRPGLHVAGGLCSAVRGTGEGEGEKRE
jgi:hypothetical protein